ncbi:MAG TPA: UDP-N-acetylglucosamine--N-acetylmuramyl-(pentapeptide) pyrophosphoryl-undecaprenol N-acetylglucosamine transferase, partial [Acidimicrobiales bacterium]|nr:UDP-N-acetylglucosamine--N-acetylmuramyl-(pentapeptide) pyrophosphoryl-undecaprenol N-acetylglucosamine transferase [Acidimicrobiales bacterium]
MNQGLHWPGKYLRVVITGGGTAGHIYPAIEVAKKLVDHGLSIERIEFVGSKRGMESRLVPDEGFDIYLLPGRGVQRKLSVGSLVSIGSLIWAVVLATGHLLVHRPDVIVTTGGYAGFPVSVAGIILGVPLVVLEPNSVPGGANKLLSKFASANTVAFPGTGLKREIVTGNPVRSDICEIGRERANRQIPFRESQQQSFNVLVFGGSLGAKRINDAIEQAAIELAERKDIVLIHIVGKRDWPGSPEPLIRRVLGDTQGNFDRLSYRPKEFERDMPSALAEADLVIARSGATTVAELCASASASILVPLPRSPGDHQRANALRLEQSGAALVIEDEACTGSKLAELIDRFCADRNRIEQMREAALG